MHFKLFNMVTLLTTFALQACNNTDKTNTTMNSDSTTTGTTTTALKPAGPKPGWAPDIDDEMAVVIEKLQSYGAPPLETLTAAEARKQPTPTTAVLDLVKEHHIIIPPSTVDTMGKDIPVNGGTIHARIYTPRGTDSAYPVIVYYHGGGWVIADLDVYDASAKGLAEQVGAVVVSVHYRQGPEHKFPTAHNDAFAAYQWVIKNAASIKGDPKKIAVAGESAGGNLACNVSIMAREKGIQMPLHQLLVYPVANNDMNSESYQKYGTAKPLSKPLIEWMVKNYLPNMDASADPRISLVKANLKGLPPTTVIAAEIDLLQTEGKLLVDKLKEAGVAVEYKLYEGVTHEFYGMAAIVPDAKDAQAMAAARLKTAFIK
ncbi:MAG TPA: alpha/beta hydrolase [Ferruginibacter sp.]|nr:alpha/beta hydrolase [Ferruginibacter sp.]